MSRGGKTARSRATRARVIEVAAEMFLERGYIETTMAGLAKAADVSVQTLYLAFGSKVDILSVVHDVAVVGDDEDVPLRDRSWVEAARAEPDGPTALRLIVEQVVRITADVSPFFSVVQAASADAEVAALEVDQRQQRLASWLDFAGLLQDKRGYDRRVDSKHAADLGYALISYDMHRMLVVELGWTREQWADLAYDGLVRRLFPDG